MATNYDYDWDFIESFFVNSYLTTVIPSLRLALIFKPGFIKKTVTNQTTA